MILTGPEIEAGVRRKDIVIKPFRKAQVSPNSYDFRLGRSCRVYTGRTLDAAIENPTRVFDIPRAGLLLRPDRVYLINTEETMGSRRFVPIIRGRSSVGRLGIFINITADLIDLGSINRWTLQLHVVQPVRIFPGMRIGQVTFWRTHGRRTYYQGKYAGRESPMPSLSYVDFK